MHRGTENASLKSLAEGANIIPSMNEGALRRLWVKSQLLDPSDRKMLIDYARVLQENSLNRFSVQLLPKSHILECPRCRSKMQLISYIRDRQVIKNILESLKMSTAPPSVYEPEEYQVFYEDWVSQ